MKSPSFTMYSVRRLNRDEWRALQKPRKQDRYGSTRTRRSAIYNGHRHDSRFEADYAALLDARHRAGEIRTWEAHPRIELRVNGEHVAWYKLDFLATTRDGIKEYIETKGAPFKTDTWRLKWRLLELQLADQIAKGKAKLILVEYPTRGGRWKGWRR